MTPEILKVLITPTLSFAIGIAITPLVTKYLYAYKAWKKNPGKQALDGSVATTFNALKAEGERRTPRMGGIVIWGSSLITILAVSLLGQIFTDVSDAGIGFISRSQTWIPLTTLIVGALVGIVNDVYDIQGHPKGLSLGRRLALITVMAGAIGWWFYAKLGVSMIGVPFFGYLDIGVFIIPFFVIFTICLYASGVIDGIDGLSGGVFATIFAAYALIAFEQGQTDLASFSAMLVGSILAFLWFNVPPARFYMTETGTMSLTLTLAVIAFMTDALGDGVGVSAFLIIGFPLVATVLSVVVQLIYKKIYGVKLLRIAPLHHHFEAIGWSSAKVTMRYWILSAMCAFVGVMYALIA